MDSDTSPVSGAYVEPQGSYGNFAISRPWWIAACFVAAGLCALRLPAILHQAGGQDEDYFAVPGWTMAREGVPRIPYLPARDPKSVFFRADEILFALPPGFFVWEAPFQLAFGPSYAAGRLASLAAGFLACLVLFGWGTRFLGPPAALVGMAIFGISRPFLFPATTARPDMLCTALLIVTFAWLWKWSRTRESFHHSAAGFFAGLALAVHPFAVVVLPLLVVWSFVHIVRATPKFRYLSIAFGLLYAGYMVLVTPFLAWMFWSMWTWRDLALFDIQFSNNVLSRAGPGLLGRLLAPGDSFVAQYRNLLELCGPWQLCLMTAGTVAALFARDRLHRRLAWWTLTIALTLAILEGTHPTKGYWSFPAALACLCCGAVLQRFGRRAWIPALAIALMMLPGAGFKAMATYVRHWGEPNYDHRAAVRQVLADFPPNAKYLVDVGCIFDFYAAGCNATLALDIDPFFRARDLPYDFLVVTRTGLRQRLPDSLKAGRRVQSYGLPDDDLAVYVEVWERAKPAQ